MLVFSASDKFSENLHIVANEPSLAFFRIQEHVRKSLPQLIGKKVKKQFVFRAFICTTEMYIYVYLFAE